MAIHKRAKISQREPSTLVVAASDSKNKNSADYVCPAADALDYITTTVIPDMPAGGGEILLLEGTYTCSTTNKPIALGSNPVVLRGQGYGTQLKLATGITSGFISGSGGYKEVHDLYINGSTTGAASAIPITFSGNYNTIDNVYVLGDTGFANYIVQLSSGNYNNITNSYFDTSVYGISVYVCGYSSVHNCKVVGVTTGAGIAIEHQNGTSNSVVGNHVVGCGYGIDVVSGNTLVNGNTIITSTNSAILMEATALYGVCSGNYINNCKHGIYLTTPVEGWMISGNTILSPSQGAANTYDVFYVDGQRNSIIGNFSELNTPKYFVEFTSNSNSNVVRDNTFINTPGTAAMSDLGSTNIYYDIDSVVYGNVQAEDTNYVVAAGDASAATPITFVIANQPDVPRNVTFTLGNGQITAFTLVVTGKDANNRDIAETFTEVGGFTQTGVRAFLSITTVQLTARTGTGAGDKLDMGIGKVFGFPGQIGATADVFAFYQNGVLSAAFTPLATYFTVEPTAIVAADDIAFTYRRNANVLKWT